MIKLRDILNEIKVNNPVYDAIGETYNGDVIKINMASDFSITLIKMGLKTLKINNPNLKSLYCSGNRLQKLDILRCPYLERLYCFNNWLTSLDVSNNLALSILHCNNNKLTHIDLSHNKYLYDISIYSNKLQLLDISNNNITYLSYDKKTTPLIR